MNIGLIHYAAPPVVGGVESVLGHHARLLADHGHQVCIIAGRGAQVDEHIPFIQIPLVDSRAPEILTLKKMLDAGHVPADFEEITAQLTQALVEYTAGLDLLIAHNVCSLVKNLPLTAALKRLSERSEAPDLILWHHDLAWTTPRYAEELHEGYPWDLLRTDWPGTTQVVVSKLRQEELANLLRVSPERINVVPNGLDIDQFLKLEPQTKKFIEQLDLLAAEPFLLLPVRITPRKNIELALHILHALRADFPHAALVVTGPLGPHNPANVEYHRKLAALRLELGLQGAAHFLAEFTKTYLPDAVIADFYRLADGLLMPSREEGFGIPVLEAGLACIPVFCSDIPPLRELGGEHVTYFSPDIHPDVGAAMLADHFTQDATYALRVKVRSHYTWQRVYRERIAPLLLSS